MTIETYADLKDKAASYQARADLTAQIPDAITFAEAKLNRELGEVLTESTLTGIVNDRSISVSALTVAAPRNLWLVTNGGEKHLIKRERGTFAYSGVAGEPLEWAFSGTNIVFDRPLNIAYEFRFEFRQRFALSDSATTNWLLTYHPDIYLAATLVWGGLFTQDDPRTAKFSTVLEDGIPSVNQYIRDQSKAELTVDPALLCMGGSTYNIETDGY